MKINLIDVGRLFHLSTHLFPQVLSVIVSRLFRQLFARRPTTTVDVQTLMSKELSEDAERNEVRCRVDQGDQIGQAMESTHLHAERRMKEDLDRRLEGPENPKNKRRTSTDE